MQPLTVHTHAHTRTGIGLPQARAPAARPRRCSRVSRRRLFAQFTGTHSAPYTAAPGGAAAARRARRETHDGRLLERSMIRLGLRRGAVPPPPRLCGQDPQGRAVHRRRTDRPGGPRAHGADHNRRRAALADRSRRALAALSRGRRSVGRRRRGHWRRGARGSSCQRAVCDRADGCVVAAAAGEAPRGLRRHRGGVRSWCSRGRMRAQPSGSAPSQRGPRWSTGSRTRGRGSKGYQTPTRESARDQALGHFVSTASHDTSKRHFRKENPSIRPVPSKNSA